MMYSFIGDIFCLSSRAVIYPSFHIPPVRAAYPDSSIHGPPIIAPGDGRETVEDDTTQWG